MTPDVIFRCATLIYLSSSWAFWRASLSGLCRKEFTETKIWRDWFQQNHYWQSWEEQIITTLTSFDHWYSYSQNVSVDRTMRWRAWHSDEFAPEFSPFHAQTPNGSSVSHKETSRMKWRLAGMAYLSSHNTTERGEKACEDSYLNVVMRRLCRFRWVIPDL